MMTPYDANDETVSQDTDAGSTNVTNAPTREEAEAAVEVLLRWAGDDPTREGLVGTPSRVSRAWKEFCVGYTEDPMEMLERTFEEVTFSEDITLTVKGVRRI